MQKFCGGEESAHWCGSGAPISEKTADGGGKKKGGVGGVGETCRRPITKGNPPKAGNRVLRLGNGGSCRERDRSCVKRKVSSKSP